MNLSWIKTIFININIFIVLIFVANISSIGVYKIYQVYKQNTIGNSTNDSRYKLPTYDGQDWAKKHFEEFGNLKSLYEDYYVWRRVPYSGETINIDNKGHRKSFTHASVNENSKTAVFVGGSTTWGTGAFDDGTIPSFFSKHMNGEYKSINLGESGYSAFQEYVYLSAQLAQGLKPDLIVSYDGVNQINSLLNGVEHFSTVRENQIRERMIGADTKDSLEFKVLIKPIIDFVSRLRDKFINEPGNAYDLSEEDIILAATETIESWLLIYNLARANNAQYIVILQPNIYLGNPKKDHIKMNKYQEKSYKLLYVKIRDLLNKEKYKELSSIVYDFTDAFYVDEYVYNDFCHVSPLGNEIIAKKIVSKLK